MRTKYCIGFFAGIFLLVSMLGIGYQLSYKYALDKQQAKAELELTGQKTESITTKGEATKNEGYYVCELHGYVVVYLHDKKTIFEVSNISLAELPGELQEEIRNGKYMETEDSVYKFLENYSS